MSENGKMSESGKMSERYSMDDMMKLLKKAENYCSDKMVRCYELYRNKGEGHFQEILDDDKIVNLNLKDDAGDPRTPINGNIEAIFFTASVKWGSENGEPIPGSPYGPDRLLIDINYLIQPSKHNLYFADFYCVKSEENNDVYHYIVLVVAEPESVGDKFCVKYLPKLDWKNNKFLRSSDENKFQVSSMKYAIVEVLYTSEINLGKAWDANKAAITKTEEYPYKYGVPKNKECKTCNITC